MVQIKQKSNKINIIALITCFMLIMVFVFGCVDFAKADSDSDISNGSLIVQIKRDDYMQEFIWSPSAKGKFCGVANTSSPQIASLVSLESFNLTQIDNVYRYDGGKDSHSTTSLSSYYASDLYRISTGSFSDSSIKEFIVSGNFLIFATDKDAYKYLKTGEINNLVYYPTGYDENIPTPANISLTFNCEFGDSFKLEEVGHPFTMTWDNVQSSDNQINYDDLTFECYVDMGYWAYKDIFGHHDDKTTGKIKLFDSSAMSKYKTCDKLGKNSDWDTWFSNVKLDIKAFGMLGQYYDFYCRYVDSSGNYGNWVKIHVSGSNSTINRKWGVIKDIDASTTVNKGYEEINGDSGEHVSGDYDNYYVGTPDGNLSNNLTSLKSNYSNLVSFYKELFSFLPAEIWIILVGLVSTMVVIAIIKFVRG